MTEQELKENYIYSSKKLESYIKLYEESIVETDKIKRELSEGLTHLHHLNTKNNEEYDRCLEQVKDNKEVFYTFSKYSLKGTRYNGHLKRSIHNFEDYLRELRNKL